MDPVPINSILDKTVIIQYNTLTEVVSGILSFYTKQRKYILMVKIMLKVLLCCFMFTVNSFAATWDAPNGSDMSWCDSANWWLGLGPPGIGDTALMNSTPYGPAIIDLTCSASAGSLIISQFGNQAELHVLPGGSLHVYGQTTLGNFSDKGILNIMGLVTIDNDLKIGYYFSPKGKGDVLVNGGILNVGGDIKIGDQGGYGTITMSSGKIDATGEIIMLNGEIQLNGGIMYASDLTFFTSNGTFNISNDGTLVILKDLSNIIGHSITGITACNGYGTTIIDYDVNKTIIKTICNCPEADITGDCVVNLYDIIKIASQWLSHG